MTPTTDTTRHPDVSEISDLTEGLLPAPHAAEVRDHVAGCELCGDVQTSLMEIRELLGAVPAPQGMPEDIASRIDAALAAETLHIAAPDDAAHVSRETELPAPRKAVRKPDAGTDTPGRPAGHPRATTGPGRRPVRRSRRRVVALGAVLGAAVVAVSVFMLQNVRPPQGDSALKAADRGSSSAAKESAAFSESTLEGRVQRLLLSTDTKPSSPDGVLAERQTPSSETQSTPPGDSHASDSPRPSLRGPAVSVPACVERGIGRKTPALALEEGTFDGSDALLVVLPHPADPALVQAYVVDATCVRQESAAKGEVLLTHAYPRP